MQLLQITTTPMKYELEVEHAKLEQNQNFQPRAEVSTTKPKLHVQSKNAEVQIDTYQARKSLGLQRIGDFINTGAQKGKDSINQKTREYVEIGKEMSNIKDGVTISNVYTQKMLSETQSSLYTAFLPSAGAEISWKPAELSMSYDPGEIDTDWEITKNMMDYVPGSVRLKILEYADVVIEYLGGPMYVPPSADPDYVQPET